MLKVIEAAGEEPITVDDAKVFLRVDTTADDELIGALISAAREFAEHYTQSTFATVTYELALDAFPVDAIDLPNAQTATVESVKYTDPTGAEVTVDPTGYALSDYGMSAFIYPRAAWPVAGRVNNAVRVRYTVEADEVPKVARAAMLELVAHFYEARENNDAIPAGVTRLLDVARVYK